MEIKKSIKKPKKPNSPKLYSFNLKIYLLKIMPYPRTEKKQNMV